MVICGLDSDCKGRHIDREEVKCEEAAGGSRSVRRLLDIMDVLEHDADDRDGAILATNEQYCVTLVVQYPTFIRASAPYTSCATMDSLQ